MKPVNLVAKPMNLAAALLLVLCPLTAIGQERPAYGLSGSVIGPEAVPEAATKLERQGQSGGAQESELSVQAYVDSQKRIAETFRRPIPDKITEQTRGDD